MGSGKKESRGGPAVLALVLLCSAGGTGRALPPGGAEGGGAQAAAPARRELDPPIAVRVDPRVELLSLVFRLAGSPEYRRARLEAYAAEADRFFEGMREHEAVKQARELRRRAGIGYDAVASFAVHLLPPDPSGKWKEDARAGRWPRLPSGEEERPRSLEARWTAKAAADFAAALRDFVAKSRFVRFFSAQEELYEEAESRMQDLLGRSLRLEWFDRFFGPRPSKTFHLELALLNGGLCFGPRVALPGGEELHCVLGVWLRDDRGRPRFDETVLPTVVHEFCHSYCNPRIDAHRALLEGPGRRLWKLSAAGMRRQAYKTWETMLKETLVRGCVVRWVARTRGPAAAGKECERQRALGFEWLGEVADLLAAYESREERGKTLDGIMPRFAEVLSKEAERLEAFEALRPKVLRMSPAPGARTDSSVTEIRVWFDRPMKRGSWSVMKTDRPFPKVAGRPSFEEDGRCFVLPVRLRPETSYELWFNRGRALGFRSAEGAPLRPVRLRFRTR